MLTCFRLPLTVSGLVLEQPLTEAIGFSNEFEDTSSMREPIQQRPGHFFVSKDLIPFEPPANWW